MRLLVDANLSPRVVSSLVESGYDAVHVFDIGLADASDPVILLRAADEHRVIVSSDTDFGALLARSQSSEPPSFCSVMSAISASTRKRHSYWPCSRPSPASSRAEPSSPCLAGESGPDAFRSAPPPTEGVGVRATRPNIPTARVRYGQ